MIPTPDELAAAAMDALMVPDGTYTCNVTDEGGRPRFHYSTQLSDVVKMTVRVVLEGIGPPIAEDVAAAAQHVRTCHDLVVAPAIEIAELLEVIAGRLHEER